MCVAVHVILLMGNTNPFVMLLYTYFINENSQFVVSIIV